MYGKILPDGIGSRYRLQVAIDLDCICQGLNVQVSSIKRNALNRIWNKEDSMERIQRQVQMKKMLARLLSKPGT